MNKRCERGRKEDSNHIKDKGAASRRKVWLNKRAEKVIRTDLSREEKWVQRKTGKKD
jgi:hypothetical protein